MNIAPDGTHEVNPTELWSMIGGGTRFSHDDIVRMMAECKRNGEDFKMVHNADRYVIRNVALVEYFTTHPTPEKPMKADEEVRILKARLEEANRKIAEMSRAGQDKPYGNYVPPPVVTPMEAETIVVPVDKPIDVSALRPAPFTSVAAELKAELKAKNVKPDYKNRKG